MRKLHLSQILQFGCLLQQLFSLSMMEPPNSDSLCDRFVTGNSEIDNWIWVIEYLAKFKSELWMLNGN